MTVGGVQVAADAPKVMWANRFPVRLHHHRQSAHEHPMENGQTSAACLANVERSNIKDTPARSRPCSCRGCPVGPPRTAFAWEEVAAPASLAFAEVFRFPWSSLNSPAATFHRTIQTLQRRSSTIRWHSQ